MQLHILMTLSRFSLITTSSGFFLGSVFKTQDNITYQEIVKNSISKKKSV